MSENMIMPAGVTGNNLPAEKPAEVSPAPRVDKKDGVMSLLCVIPAYIFVGYAFWRPYSLYVMIFNLLFMGLILIYMKTRGEKIRRTATFSCVFLFALSFLFNMTFIITDNPVPKVLAGVFSFALTAYALFLAASGKRAFPKEFLSDIFYTLLVIPFRGFGAAPAAAGSLFKGAKLKKVGQIALGLLLGLPMTLIVAVLLISADSEFGDMLSKLFESLNMEDVFIFGFRFGFSLPLSFYLFGMLFANIMRKNTVGALNPEAFRIIPPFVVYSGVTPVCALYVLFFFTQLKYFISAFLGELPGNFIYSEYARRGFFELCAVAAINAALIIVVNVAFKREKDKKHVGLSIYSAVLVFFTVVLITTAISKMAMYIGQYGLSPMRVYTSWFMLLLMLVFAVFFVWGLVLKRNAFKPVFAVFAVMFGILCFGDIDGMIAKYNIDAYKSGKLSEVDVSLFYYDLSDSAVKHAVALADDPTYGGEIRSYLQNKQRRYDNNLYYWYEWNLEKARAKSILDDYFDGING